MKAAGSGAAVTQPDSDTGGESRREAERSKRGGEGRSFGGFRG